MEVGGMNDDLLSKAVRNNSNWCDLICATHGIETQFLQNVWLTKSPVPNYYPNLITLNSETKAEEISEISLDHFSIKDSFGKLNLGYAGFSKLFDASWIGLENKRNETSNIDSWEKLSLDEELTAWENAWGNTMDQKIFLPNLLLEPQVGIYAKKEGAGIVAGFITFDSDGVISVSNFFNYTKKEIWPEIINIIDADKPLVGYEKGEDLEYAKGAGFEEIGRVTIWKK